MDWLELIPAYGLDYTRAADVRADWKADMDFKVALTGQYINRSGAAAAGVKVTIRYAKSLKVLVP